MISGIHHITLITRKVQANVDFYAGFLGLRIVKQTGGFEDAEQLHLFYGDRSGTPGSLITFLVWEDGARGVSVMVRLVKSRLPLIALPSDSGSSAPCAITCHPKGPCRSLANLFCACATPMV